MTVTKPPRRRRPAGSHLASCLVCRCTPYQPCKPPCSNAALRTPGHRLCSTCAAAVTALAQWQAAACRPSWRQLRAAVTAHQANQTNDLNDLARVNLIQHLLPRLKKGRL